MILDQIIKHKRVELARQKEILPLKELLLRLPASAPSPGRFRKAISRAKKWGDPIRLIAEIKRASPSKGIICKDFDPLRLAGIYARNGAAAISVLTESKFFLGNLKTIAEVKRIVSLPVLRKDFIIDEYQIYESAQAGADAILLIAACLPKETLANFLSIAREVAIDCLIEVHTEEELEKVISTDVEIIGINNRNLYTFEVDLNITSRLKLWIPAGITVVSESGIRTRRQAKFLEAKGVDAILVGEALLASQDIGGKVRELLGTTNSLSG
ncbi:MAG: indole-3-glycerol phosphate synthase TrpC [bacterium]